MPSRGPNPSAHAARYGWGRSAVLLAIVIASGSVACRGPDATSDGDRPLLTVTEDLRIGDRNDPDLGFSRLTEAAMDGDGRIYAFEWIDREIRVFDADGQFVRSIGGPGEGPGEFGQMVSNFGVVGDTVWVVESLPTNRLTLFDREGDVLSAANAPPFTVELPGDGMTGIVTPRGMRSDGLFTSHMIGRGYIGGPDGAAVRVTEEGAALIPRVLYSPAGEIVDTAGAYPYLPRESQDIQELEIEGTPFLVPMPPTDQLLLINMSDGWFEVERPRPTTSDSASFTIRRMAETGDTVYVRVVPYRPSRYPDAALDSAAWVGARTPSGPYLLRDGPPTIPDEIDVTAVFLQVRDEMDFPEFQVPVEYGIAGDDGTLWLREEDDGVATLRWWIFEGTGDLRGLIDLRRDLQVLWVGRDMALAVGLDELEVPWLLRLRIGER